MTVQRALGVCFTCAGEAVKARRVLVEVADGEVSITRLEPWSGAAGDEARSVGDLLDALTNPLDRVGSDGAVALAVKRAESTRGRPTKDYDQKMRAEGVAMTAAAAQGRPYRGYRTNQLTRGSQLRQLAQSHADYPSDARDRDAVAAACEVLAELAKRDEGD
jgi:hypothetical protein